MKMVLKIVSEKRGNHIHQTLFTGVEGYTLANVGRLVMEVGEWQLFGVALSMGAERMKGHLKVIEEGWSPEKEVNRSG